MEDDVSIQKKEFNLNEFMDKVRRVGKGDEVNYVPTNISPPTLSKSILPITNNPEANADEVITPPIISEPKATFSALPITSNSVLPTTSNHGKNVDEGEVPPTISKPNIIFSKVPTTNRDNIGGNADEEEEIQLNDSPILLKLSHNSIVPGKAFKDSSNRSEEELRNFCSFRHKFLLFAHSWIRAQLTTL